MLLLTLTRFTFTLHEWISFFCTTFCLLLFKCSFRVHWCLYLGFDPVLFLTFLPASWKMSVTLFLLVSFLHFSTWFTVCRENCLIVCLHLLLTKKCSLCWQSNSFSDSACYYLDFWKKHVVWGWPRGRLTNKKKIISESTDFDFNFTMCKHYFKRSRLFIWLEYDS